MSGCCTYDRWGNYTGCINRDEDECRSYDDIPSPFTWMYCPELEQWCPATNFHHFQGASHVCCLPDTDPDFPCKSIPDTQCAERGGTPRLPWAFCNSPFSHPCEDFVPTGACCFPDGTCQPDLTGTQCQGLGGHWVGPDTHCDMTECLEFFPACRKAKPEGQPAGDLLDWTTDLCAAVAFAPVIRPRGHGPLREDGTWDPTAEGWEPAWRMREGDFELLSVNPVRAMMTEEPRNDTEPCVRHYAKLGRLRSGYWAALYCSQPGWDSESRLNDRQFHVAGFYCEPPAENEPVSRQRGVDVVERLEPFHRGDRLLPPGFCGWIGYYHTPFWTEAWYHGEAPVCGGIQE